jgi:quercetin dioxygenase-like cupin family protein
MRNKISTALLLSSAFAVMAAALAGDQVTAAGAKGSTYSYATAGVLDERNSGEIWRILLDHSNLGGNELEVAELTLAAGTTVGSHTHQSLEVIYVLSGAFGHEVNGHYYLLKPGMIGIVRPGDHVRHIVPKDTDAKLLIIWAPAGEAQRILDYTKGTPIKPVAETKTMP